MSLVGGTNLVAPVQGLIKSLVNYVLLNFWQARR